MVLVKIIELKGIGPSYAEKLESIGIYTTKDLLQKGSTPIGRTEISKKSKIAETLLLKWVNMVDLFRIKGLGAEIWDLLDHLGIETVSDLAKKNPDYLYQNMKEINSKKNIINRTPTPRQVENWITWAKVLPIIVTYQDGRQPDPTEDFKDFKSSVNMFYRLTAVANSKNE